MEEQRGQSGNGEYWQECKTPVTVQLMAKSPMHSRFVKNICNLCFSFGNYSLQKNQQNVMYIVLNVGVGGMGMRNTEMLIMFPTRKLHIVVKKTKICHRKLIF